MPRSRPERSIRFEIVLIITVLSFAAGIALGAWWEKQASDRALRTRDGILGIVSNIRSIATEPELKQMTAYTDITQLILDQQLVPPDLLQGKKIRTPWDTPVTAAVNLGSSIPVIEVSLKGLTTSACERTIAAVSKRFYNVNDLRSIWVGPPGVTHSRFPIAPEKTGCGKPPQQVTFQFQLQPRRQ